MSLINIQEQAQEQEHHKAVRTLTKAKDIIISSVRVQDYHRNHINPVNIIRASKRTKAHHESRQPPEDRDRSIKKAVIGSVWFARREATTTYYSAQNSHLTCQEEPMSYQFLK